MKGHCPRATVHRSSCKRRDCPACGPRWARDVFKVTSFNLASYGGPVVLVSVTPPGADRLPWDEEHCRHPRGGRHDGKRGCRAEQRPAREWSETAVLRFAMLRRAATAYARYHAGPVRLLERVWEPQKRGVPHVHLVLGAATDLELRAAALCVEKMKELAPEYDFGFVDARGRKRSDDPRSRGRRVNVDGILLKLIPAAEAARYLAGYLTGRSGRKTSIRETVADPAMTALAGGVAKRQRLPLWWLTPRLTRETGVTMRTLRRARHLWATFRGLCEPPRWSSAEEALTSALVFRRLFGQRGDDEDEHADELAAARRLGQAIEQRARESRFLCFDGLRTYPLPAILSAAYRDELAVMVRAIASPALDGLPAAA